MGRFDPAYVSEFSCALVRVEGRIVAFANLWTTANHNSFSMDLMRYGAEAPKNIMDYLFVELLQWGREQGYRAFEFGMAPLAGLEARPLAPWMSRLGRLVFERGEDLYNFQGVRRYKDKYDPVWQPRYIAAANKWAITMALFDVRPALLGRRSPVWPSGPSGSRRRQRRSANPRSPDRPLARRVEDQTHAPVIGIVESIDLARPARLAAVEAEGGEEGLFLRRPRPPPGGPWPMASAASSGARASVSPPNAKVRAGFAEADDRHGPRRHAAARIESRRLQRHNDARRQP
ncbi:MAG: phosphatidylglycerol lysyltransferase domain-containing protein [Caulobacteraceae bacterium]